MIIVLKANRSEEQVKNFISHLTDRYDVRSEERRVGKECRL